MFTSDITPLILAAHRNNYEILKILLDRGATIPQPHDIRYIIKTLTHAHTYYTSRINLIAIPIFFLYCCLQKDAVVMIVYVNSVRIRYVIR